MSDKILNPSSTYDFIIIGAGISGLATAKALSQKNKSFLLIEETSKIGGKLNFYLDKEITNIPGILKITAHDYLKNFIDTKVNLNEKTLSIHKFAELYLVKTTKGNYYGKNVILCAGFGTRKPRKLLVGDKEVLGVDYYLNNLENYSSSDTIAILGGGMTAIENAKRLASIVKDVYLIHRRGEFRGDITSLKDFHNITILAPALVENVLKEEKFTIFLDYKRTLLVDKILVNFGIVREHSYTLDEGVKCVEIGDIISQEDQVYTIAKCLAQVDKFIASLRQ
jgi:thioredoxin reductase (NADPH)